MFVSFTYFSTRPWVEGWFSTKVFGEGKVVVTLHNLVWVKQMLVEVIQFRVIPNDPFPFEKVLPDGFVGLSK